MWLENFKLYRSFVGGKWGKFNNKWYPVKNIGPLVDFLDVDDGGGMVHYSHSEIQARESYCIKPRTNNLVYKRVQK